MEKIRRTETADGGFMEAKILPLNPKEENDTRTVQKLEYRYYDRELHLVKREIGFVFDEKYKMKI